MCIHTNNFFFYRIQIVDAQHQQFGTSPALIFPYKQLLFGFHVYLNIGFSVYATLGTLWGHSSVTKCRWGWGVSEFPEKKRYEGVMLNVISVTRGVGGGPICRKIALRNI